jgi:myo-inositol-1-phosphate synthase
VEGSEGLSTLHPLLEGHQLMSAQKIRPAEGKLAVLMPGLGAVATTTIAGAMLARKGLGSPVGSLTQMGRIRLGKRTSGTNPFIKEFVPVAGIKDLAFGGWDVFPENAYEAAAHADVLQKQHLDQVKDELSAIKPMKAVFYPEYVKRLHGPNVKTESSKAAMVEALRADIKGFIKDNGCSRGVAVWCGSTEAFLPPGEVHQSIEAFEAGLATSSPQITNSQMYAWACVKEGVPFANGSPNFAVDFPAIWNLSKERQVALAGKDFKTGQTLMKTVIAPALKARMLGLHGWYSTNILGNRDGEILDDPESFKTKEATKLGVLDTILQADLYKDLYGDFHHKVRIDYYPPRGDQKEGWDNIDLFGWLGYPMQMKINFLCRDSILAAPIVLDLALFMDLAQRAGMSNTQEWLSFYFKSPMTAPGLYPEHDLFIQHTKLKNTLRWMMGEEVITHLGREYYEADGAE